jgi:hypothetical protein
MMVHGVENLTDMPLMAACKWHHLLSWCDLLTSASAQAMDP